MSMVVHPVQCGRCGSPVSPEPGARQMRCDHCGAVLTLGPEGWGTASPLVHKLSTWLGPVGEYRGWGKVLAALSALMGLSVVGVSVAAYWMSSPAGDSSGAVDGKLQWYTLESEALPALAPQAAGEPSTIIGLIRRGYEANQISVAAFSGRDFSQKWELGPFAYTGGGYRNGRRVAVSGSFAVAMAGANRLAMIDVSTGRLIKQLSLPAPLKDLCAAPLPSSMVWVDLAENSDHLLKLPEGTLEPMARPDWCPELSESNSLDQCRALIGPAHCAPASKAPSLQGASLYYALETPSLSVAVGVPAAPLDTNKSLVAAYRPGAAEVSWTRVLDSRLLRENLTDNRFIGVLRGPQEKCRLIALESDSGKQLWDVELPWSDELMVGPLLIQDGRIYLARNEWLDIFDLQTGQALGHIGSPE